MWEMGQGADLASKSDPRTTARWEPWLLLGLAVTAGTLVAACFRWPLFEDEAFSALAAGKSLVGILHLLRRDTNPPLYFFILHFWVKLAGTSEAALRALSVPSFLAACWVTWRIARRASGSGRAALYAAFFYGASSEAVYQSMLARCHALLGLLAALSTLFFLEAFILPGRSRRAEWGYLAANVLGTFTHYWFFFLFPAQAAACVILLPRRRWWRVAVDQIVSVVPFAVLWSPELLRQMHDGGTAWMPHLSRAYAISALTQFYVGHRVGAAFWAICLLLVLTPKGGLTRALALLRRPEYLTLVMIVALGLGVPLLISAFHPIYFPDLYTIIALPALAALLGWALSEIVPRRWLAAWCCVIVAGWGMVAILQVAGRRPDLGWMGERLMPMYEAGAERAAAKEVCHSASKGDWLIFTSVSGSGMQYYLQRFGCARRLHLTDFPASIALHPGWDWPRRDASVLVPQAKALAARIDSSFATRQDAGNVWVFRGHEQAEGAALDKGFAGYFTVEHVLPLAGPGFHEVVVLKAAGGRP